MIKGFVQWILFLMNHYKLFEMDNPLEFKLFFLFWEFNQMKRHEKSYFLDFCFINHWG